ncbi:hypothetical protein RIF29_18639 [Crotalaria pallida]|uniref:Uncharacterized protein n=1 Tax=Crotalaria pallida TaxID=3830 RepID=A0AAN9EZ86_CROPI
MENVGCFRSNENIFLRLVNGVVEKTRKKEFVSIAVATDAIGIPRMLIDIRHEASHCELPSLKVARTASIKLNLLGQQTLSQARLMLGKSLDPKLQFKTE